MYHFSSSLLPLGFLLLHVVEIIWKNILQNVKATVELC